ncbi:DUF4350 domain-containing protein [Streptomyces solicathayae]|uniref:DUF4350 domain-containing protein n=1 Tax=Streptomyces solicathayae TaxID=3081768 RepID=A0ABZ0LX17_9ACTN|nr:DUF4350 domain-containing protein [Streptomyces sp. HUAS YS2]WOX24053.1 DUF4350 domain-containing protein [Streptomyces sp. HUAS YS2]
MSRTPTSPTSTAASARQMWTRTRGLLVGLAILVIGAVALAAVRSGDQHGRLDPRSADKFGSRAVAEILKAQGVTIRPVSTLAEATSAAGPDTTLLVTVPDLLIPAQQESLRSAMVGSGGRTVLLGAGPASVRTLVPGVDSDSGSRVKNREPACSFPPAVRAGSVEIGGEQYTSTLPASRTTACYPNDGRPTLLRVQDDADGDTVLVGSPDFLYNDRLDEQGNASLALQLLGSRPHLVWYLPSLSDPSVTEGDSDDSSEEGAAEGFLSLVPSGWLWGTLQLFVAALLAAVWRARRLGPLVTERLPVAVRASEATEGRARLYRKADARDRAATVLRAAARTRIAPLLGVAPRDAHTPDSLLPAVSARLSDGAHDAGDLLFGPAPTDDAALIRLADQLDALEREVRTS